MLSLINTNEYEKYVKVDEVEQMEKLRDLRFRRSEKAKQKRQKKKWYDSWMMISGCRDDKLTEEESLKVDLEIAVTHVHHFNSSLKTYFLFWLS